MKPHILKCLAIEPIRGQIFPLGIALDDQSNFLFPSPAFNLLFSGYGVFYQAVFFLIDKSIDLVFLSEAGNFGELVFLDPSFQIVGHSCIESARFACEDVNAVNAFRHVWVQISE